MAQIRVKQIKGLQSIINSITGIDTIVETYSTSADDGSTGIFLTHTARETDAIKIHVNGIQIDAGYYWKYNNELINTASLPSNSELIWDSSISKFKLENTDVIQITYETESNGSINPDASNGNQGSQGAQGPQGAQGAQGATGNSINLNSINSSIIPDVDIQYDLGSPEKRFRDLYLSGNTLYLGNTPISVVNGQLTLNGSPISGNIYTRIPVSGYFYAKTPIIPSKF